MKPLEKQEVFMATHLYTYITPTNKKHLDHACQVLQSGGIIAYPTDINWAVGCDASNRRALDKLQKLKAPSKNKPLSLLCDSMSMISTLATVDHRDYRILRKVIPGAYTILLKRNKTLPKQLQDKRKIVGLRVPNSPLLIELINLFGKPLATSSLPSFQEQQGLSPTYVSYGYQVNEQYGNQLDLILDLGEEVPYRETTVLDFSDHPLKLIRKGVGDISVFSEIIEEDKP